MKFGKRAQKNYVSISLQMAVVWQIRAHLAEHPEDGYTGIADFVRDAIRAKLKGEGGK